jgi:hypothetical protein
MAMTVARMETFATQAERMSPKIRVAKNRNRFMIKKGQISRSAGCLPQRVMGWVWPWGWARRCRSR